MEEKRKKEDHTAVLLPKSEASLRCDDKDSAANNFMDTTSVHINECSRKTRIFKSIFVWIACSILGLYSLNKTYQLYMNKCVEDWGMALDYPDTFPKRDELHELEMMTQSLALRHGKDILGKCYQMGIIYFPSSATKQGCRFARPPSDYVPASAIHLEAAAPSSAAAASFFVPTAYDDGPVQPVPTNVPINNRHSSRAFDAAPETSLEFLPVAAPSSSAAVFSNAPNQHTPYQFETLHPVSIENAQVISLAISRVTRHLYVHVADDINVSVNILTAAQAGQNSTAVVDAFLRPRFNDGVDIFQLVELQATSFRGGVQMKLNLKPGVPAGSSTVNCLLQIVIPDTFSSTIGSSTLTQNCSSDGLRRFELDAKQGHIQADHMVFNYLSIKLGRGVVDLKHLDVRDLRVAVLDGNANLLGIKTGRSLAAGVIRGSSTVLAKIHPEDTTYAVINMCADGNTYTDIMTTEEDHDKLAANLHVYRETGTRPLEKFSPAITLSGHAYYSEPGLAHLDTNSTDVYKTGYMVAPNSGSDILVYAGAKSSASRIGKKSRFLYGYYYEEVLH